MSDPSNHVDSTNPKKPRRVEAPPSVAPAAVALADRAPVPTIGAEATRVSESDMLYLALRAEQLRSADLAVQVARHALAEAETRITQARANLDTEKARIREAYRLGDSDSIDLGTGVITRGPKS